MIRFVHTADIHFGVENYGKIDPETGIHTRLLDFNKALNACIDVAIEQEVDFFLFAGDAYKTAHPSPTQQQLLMKCFLRLHEANIPTISIIGNHDNPLSFGKASALDVFGDVPLPTMYVVSKPRIIQLKTKNGPVNIVGIPWPTRNTISISKEHLSKSAEEITSYITRSVIAIIQNLAQQLDPSIPAVMAGHLTVSEGIFSGSEKRALLGTDPTFLPSHLAISPFDYVALGHLHRHQNLNKNGHPPLVYSGSVERIDFGERKEEKGFCLVTIEAKGKTSYKFIPTPTRRFVQVECTLSANRDQTEQLLESLADHDLRDTIVKIIYTLPPGQRDTIDLYEIQKACSQAHYITGIIPIQQAEKRERRTSAMNVSMNTQELLETYLESQETLKKRKQDLLKQALELESSMHDDSKTP
ncbi:exonuclease SbcCD subunit D [Candidatus Babeliales bacterium]|nr:exonuclease SbcCD subunit D [Candidatus Babeliales bacterium]